MDGSFELLRVQDPATDSGGGGGGYGGRDFVFFILFMLHREPLPETFAGRSPCRGETRAPSTWNIYENISLDLSNVSFSFFAGIR